MASSTRGFGALPEDVANDAGRRAPVVRGAVVKTLVERSQSPWREFGIAEDVSGPANLGVAGPAGAGRSLVEFPVHPDPGDFASGFPAQALARQGAELLGRRAYQASGVGDAIVPYGGSDDASFTAHQVPTLFFFSGLHSDYHKPSDTWDKINAGDAVRLLGTVADVTTSLAEAPDRPQFVRVQASARPSASSGAGYGAYLGSVPDFGGPANAGVRLSDVRDGSPAAKAGLRAGDTLVEFDGKPVRNLYDLTYELQQHRPDDAVTLKVIRDGKPVEVKAVLGRRN